MRVQSGHRDTNGSVSSTSEKVRKKSSNTHDFRRCQKTGNIGQRNVGCDKGDGDLATRQAHGKVTDSPALREKFRLAGKGEPDIVHRFFGHWTRDHGLDFSPLSERGRFLQSPEGMFGGSTFRLFRA